jgi:hypothetical protein
MAAAVLENAVCNETVVLGPALKVTRVHGGSFVNFALSEDVGFGLEGLWRSSSGRRGRVVICAGSCKERVIFSHTLNPPS